jgi:hypothetical protein
MAIERDALNASRIKSDLREPHLGGPFSLQCGGTMPLQFVIELFLIRKFKSLVFRIGMSALGHNADMCSAKVHQ